MDLPIDVKVYKETNINPKYERYIECQRCKSKLTATLTWANGKIITDPTFVGTRKFCDQCKTEKKLEVNKSNKVRKNINCKECGNPNPNGRSFCSETCSHTNYLKRRAVKRAEFIANKNKIKESIHNQIVEYYKLLINEVSSLDELYELDLNRKQYKKSRHWILRHCGRPEWMLSAEEYIDKVQKEKRERDSIKVDEVTKLPYIKRIIKRYYNTENHLKIECECTNGHILKRSCIDLLKETKCPTCEIIELTNLKKLNKEIESESIRIKKEQTKLTKDLERVKIVSDFIESGEYKKYDNWANSPISYEYVWLRNGAGIGYLTNDFKEKLDSISYFEYMSASKCPYPTKENHKWCRKCKKEQHVDDFRSVFICKECALQYRRDTYYEADKIQGKINYHTNPMVKLHTLVKVYVTSALKGKPKSYRTKDILGIEWDVFRDYIEGMFEPWMNWDNHGHGKGKWALQHIIPKTYAETEDDIYRLNYYKNLMPMDFSDNGALHDRILRYQLNEWHYDNCGDFLDKYKDRILDSLDEIYK
jgi:predicted nucleic acid-binding Zn ribbon protein